MSESPHQSLYQKYRPHTFDDVVEQDFVKKVLMNSCRNNKIHHGYIFFGFHGTGKTTLARIFAQTVNCTSILPDGNPCGKCQNCIAFAEKKMIDVIEIDAASYTGVDNIREVIDHAKFTPTQGKYKIYIIDEVHMLSKGAFNALLKTLEEPPKHVIFLLATTEINKVPDTVLSRVIRFDLERISDSGIKWLLEKVCQKEQIKTEDEAINLIVHRARWSMRDALTIVEKCIFDNALTLSHVEWALHLVSQDFLNKTLQACISWDGKEIQEILEKIQKIGINVRTFASQMTEYIVDHIEIALSKKQFPLYKNAFDRFTKIYVESQKVAIPMDILIMSLCECITKNEDAIKIHTHEYLCVPDTANTYTWEGSWIQEITQNTYTNTNTEPETQINDEQITTVTDVSDIRNIHEESMEFSKENFIDQLIQEWLKPTLVPLLRTAEISLEETWLYIKTTLFASNKLQEQENSTILHSTWNKYWAHQIHISIYDDSAPIETSIIDDVKEIFW